MRGIDRGVSDFRFEVEDFGGGGEGSGPFEICFILGLGV